MVHNKQGIDMLHGRIWTKVLRFALPVAATGILEQLFNASGIMIVGNFSQSDGTAAVAAVGSNAPVTGLILNLFIGIALGANVVIANAIGRGSREAVRNAVHTSIVTALIGGVIVAIIGELLAGPLLGMLNVTADVFPLALAYLRIYLIGMPVILLYNFETAIFRSIGDTQAPLAVLAISGVLNVTMGLIFVVLFHWGVSGVATATVIANVVSSMILLYRLVHTDAAIHVDLRELGIDWFTLRQILRIALICHQLTADGVDEGLVLLYQPVKFQCIQWLLSASFLPGISSALSIYTNQRGQNLQNHGKNFENVVKWPYQTSQRRKHDGLCHKTGTSGGALRRPGRMHLRPAAGAAAGCEPRCCP